MYLPLCIFRPIFLLSLFRLFSWVSMYLIVLDNRATSSNLKRSVSCSLSMLIPLSSWSNFLKLPYKHLYKYQRSERMQKGRKVWNCISLTTKTYIKSKDQKFIIGIYLKQFHRLMQVFKCDTYLAYFFSSSKLSDLEIVIWKKQGNRCVKYCVLSWRKLRDKD